MSEEECPPFCSAGAAESDYFLRTALDHDESAPPSIAEMHFALGSNHLDSRRSVAGNNVFLGQLEADVAIPRKGTAEKLTAGYAR